MCEGKRSRVQGIAFQAVQRKFTVTTCIPPAWPTDQLAETETHPRRKASRTKLGNSAAAASCPNFIVTAEKKCCQGSSGKRSSNQGGYSGNHTNSRSKYVAKNITKTNTSSVTCHAVQESSSHDKSNGAADPNVSDPPASRLIIYLRTAPRRRLVLQSFGERTKSMAILLPANAKPSAFRCLVRKFRFRTLEEIKNETENTAT